MNINHKTSCTSYSWRTLAIFSGFNVKCEHPIHGRMQHKSTTSKTSLVPRPRLPKLRRGPGTDCVRMHWNSRNSKKRRIFSVHTRYLRSWLERISMLLCCMRPWIGCSHLTLKPEKIASVRHEYEVHDVLWLIFIAIYIQSSQLIFVLIK